MKGLISEQERGFIMPRRSVSKRLLPRRVACPCTGPSRW